MILFLRQPAILSQIKAIFGLPGYLFNCQVLEVAFGLIYIYSPKMTGMCHRIEHGVQNSSSSNLPRVLVSKAYTTLTTTIPPASNRVFPDAHFHFKHLLRENINLSRVIKLTRQELSKQRSTKAIHQIHLAIRLLWLKFPGIFCQPNLRRIRNLNISTSNINLFNGNTKQL